MNIKCPHCGTEYEVEKQDMYRYTKCEVCGKGFVAGATTSLLTGDRSVASKKDELLNGASDGSRQGASRHPIIQVKSHKIGQANTKASFQNSTSQASRPSSTVKPTATDRTTAREPSLSAAPQEAAPQKTIKTVGIWAAIAVLGFIVVVMIISTAFLAYIFGGRCHLIGEGIERI